MIHDGQAGWIYDDYLDGRGNGPRPGINMEAISAVNHRAEPNTKARVITVIPRGGIVTRSDKTKNGFIYVSYAGNWGWAHQDYLR